MRMQSSLEFLLILSAVSVLALSALVFYGRGMALNNEALGGMRDIQVPNSSVNLTVVPDPQISIYIPLNSSLLSRNTFEVEAYGCGNGNASLSFSSSSVAFSYDNLSVEIRNVTIVSGQFEPTLRGLNRVNVSYNLACENKSIESSRTFNTYATGSAAYGVNQTSFYIHRNSESLEYRNSSAQVLELVSSNHCTITDVWTGSVYTVPGQCGTGNAWDYSLFDGSCGEPPYWSYSRTYCIVPVLTGYNISSDGQYDYGMEYNISVEIATQGGTIEASLSNSTPTGRMTLNGLPVGNATVASVESSPSQQTSILSNQSGYWVANQGDYDAYVQAENNLYSTLSFYNASSVSGPTQSSIQELVSAFNSSSEKLVGSEGESANIECSSENGGLDCPAGYPFSYVIDANLTENLGLQNSTLYYQGSEIIINEK